MATKKQTNFDASSDGETRSLSNSFDSSLDNGKPINPVSDSTSSRSFNPRAAKSNSEVGGSTGKEKSRSTTES